ncbi:hypothetical protein H8959_003071 [Pygathrix nigripes]
MEVLPSPDFPAPLQAATTPTPAPPPPSGNRVGPKINTHSNLAGRSELGAWAGSQPPPRGAAGGSEADHLLQGPPGLWLPACLPHSEIQPPECCLTTSLSQGRWPRSPPALRGCPGDATPGTALGSPFCCREQRNMGCPEVGAAPVYMSCSQGAASVDTAVGSAGRWWGPPGGLCPFPIGCEKEKPCPQTTPRWKLQSKRHPYTPGPRGVDMQHACSLQVARRRQPLGADAGDEGLRPHSHASFPRQGFEVGKLFHVPQVRFSGRPSPPPYGSPAPPPWAPLGLPAAPCGRHLGKPAFIS